MERDTDRWRELSENLTRVLDRIFRAQATYMSWQPMESAAGREILELLDRCEILVGTNAVREALGRDRAAVKRFMSISRAMAEVFVKLGARTTGEA